MKKKKTVGEQLKDAKKALMTARRATHFHFNEKVEVQKKLDEASRANLRAMDRITQLERDKHMLELHADQIISGLLAKFMVKAQEAVAAQNWEPIVRTTIHEQVREVLKRIDFRGKNLEQFIEEATKQAVVGPTLVTDAG